MKVGDTGEAFFVFETDQDVPADMQTSPITGPVADEEDEEEVSLCLLTSILSP
jgi:phosphatidate phosphatase LPIN